MGCETVLKMANYTDSKYIGKTPSGYSVIANFGSNGAASYIVYSPSSGEMIMQPVEWGVFSQAGPVYQQTIFNARQWELDSISMSLYSLKGDYSNAASNYGHMFTTPSYWVDFAIALGLGYLGEVAIGAKGGTGAKSTIQANKAAGDAFEKQVMGQLEQTQSGVVQQVTVKTESGVKTRIDLMGRDASGNIVCTECKASATAPLTPNQKIAFPEIQQSGATVVGQGKPGFPGGTKIPPTTVDIVRP